MSHGVFDELRWDNVEFFFVVQSSNPKATDVLKRRISIEF
jgi:hypothetical protein